VILQHKAEYIAIIREGGLTIILARRPLWINFVDELMKAE